MNICVFCSSSDDVNKVYKDAAVELGSWIGNNKHKLVFGGAKVGLMGILARSVHKHGGTVTGIIPGFIKNKNLSYNEADNLIVSIDMSERKAMLEHTGNAFIVMPGGFGTLEEAMEVITKKQLALHHKPIIFLNTNNFYKPLVSHFENCFKEKFTKPELKELYFIADTVKDMAAYLQNYAKKHLPKAP